MSQPGHPLPPPPAPTTGRRWSWVRPAAAALALLGLVAAGFDVLADDDRLRERTALLWPMTVALLIAAVPTRSTAPVLGPSPWTPGVLRVLSVLGGLAGGVLLLAAGLSGSPDADPAALPTALTLLALLVVALVITIAVLVRGAARGLSQRAQLLPWLSAADRARVRDRAAAPVALYVAGCLLAPWLPSGPLLWVPVGLAFAGLMIAWAWWATRPPSAWG